MTAQPDNTPLALRKLEEAQAFADHRADELDAQVTALHKRLEQAISRLSAIESRLGFVAEKLEAIDRPPAPDASGEQ